MRLRRGTLVAGRYRVERLLDRGGQAAIYVAQDTKFDERVALKVAAAGVTAAWERLRERFRREARIGNRLGRTPGFVRAFDWGEFPPGDRRLYLALDLVEGATTLDLDEGPRRARLERLREAARLVGEAHRQGVVHRDVKPDNFLRAPDGRLFLTDFGLAKLAGEREVQAVAAASGRARAAPRAPGPALTRTGDWHGTPLYMAPEQFEDMKRADARADVYALGVMLFQALTGAYPYARAVPRTQRRVLQGELAAPRPRDHDRSVPPRLDALCARALELDRERRVPSVVAFLGELDLALREDLGGSGPRPRPAGASGAGRRPRTTSRARPAAPALPRGLRPGARPGELVWRRDGTAFAWVPPGAFAMGSDAREAFANEQPVHPVALSRGLFLARTAVTWGQYRRFCRLTERAPPIPSFDVTDAHPVHGVSWHDAQAYCAWAGLRLPREAEREWAARGPDGRRYPWGNEEPDRTRCRWAGAGGRGTAPAGSLPAGASPFGCLDLAGNVWEWVEDVFADYPAAPRPGAPAAPRVDPTGPPRGRLRAARGGAWSSAAAYCRTTSRCGLGPRVRAPNLGFRVALSPVEDEDEPG